MQKEIQLALNFSKAPLELQNAAKAYDDIAKKLAKAQAKLIEAEKEIQELSFQEGESLKIFRKLLNAWVP